MATKDNASKIKEDLVNENLVLQSRLDEAEQTLNAIKNGEIDALVTPNNDGAQIYTLNSADSLYRNIVQDMSEGVATLTFDGTILYGNKQLACLLDIPLEKLSGQRFNDFILQKDLVLYKNIYKKGLENKSNSEIKIKSVKGKIIPVHISINRLKDLKGVYIVLTDLSEQKHREKLARSLKELERSNAELQQFAYVASHDLREPLRMITSFLQLLERRYKDQLDKDANEFIEYAVDGAKRLDQMIKDILEYSRVTREKLELKQVNIEKVLEETITTLKVLIDENDAIITNDPLPTIYADKQLMIQLLQNLIGNAVKYRSQETPKIHMSAKKEDDHYLFSIKDNGIGISPKHLKQIFTIFKRLHTQNEYEGTGIGLAITQKIVQQFNGEIWAESELGKGTTFYFRIPIKTEEYTNYF